MFKLLIEDDEEPVCQTVKINTLMEFLILFKDIITRINIKCEDELEPYLSGDINAVNIDDLMNLMLQLLEKIFNNFNSKLAETQRDCILKIKTYIDRYYYKDISLSMFSDRFYFGKDYLSKMFKDEFGYGIYEYVLKVRMEKAKEMLKNPKIKIKAIAEMLGYRDNNYFSKAFKKYIGISPSEYKEKYSAV